jgi:radical SAM superfamily enzyme YgiQ (UPF0313 family)
MNILLLSMPDSFEHTPSLTIRMPNGALASLAGNVDQHHRVAVADLVLVQDRVRETIERLMRDVDPAIVGLSIMTFQRRTARRVVALVRQLKPGVRIVVGGYDPSLASDVYENGSIDIDFIVRGEGDITFRELVRAFENGASFDGIAGLSFRQNGRWVRNAARGVSDLDGSEIRLPDRESRVLDGYTMMGRQADVIET